MSPSWVTVASGSFADLMVHQGALLANGIPTLLTDPNPNLLDPFKTRAMFFGANLQVPSDRVAEAKQVLDYRPPGVERAIAAPDPIDERLRKLSQTIRWASIATITAPYAVYLAFFYLLETRHFGRRPEGHAWTIASIVYSAILVFVLVSILLGR